MLKSCKNFHLREENFSGSRRRTTTECFGWSRDQGLLELQPEQKILAIGSAPQNRGVQQ
jgi:hypothetical protein